MMNLEKEYHQAEQEYDLMAFDADPNMVYELTVCHSKPSSGEVAEEMVYVKQTIHEIKTEINRLDGHIGSGMNDLLVIAYEKDDSKPVPAYLIIRKELCSVACL